MQEDKEERIHINKIDPLDMNTWKFLIRAHIKAKGGWMLLSLSDQREKEHS